MTHNIGELLDGDGRFGLSQIDGDLGGPGLGGMPTAELMSKFGISTRHVVIVTGMISTEEHGRKVEGCRYPGLGGTKDRPASKADCDRSVRRGIALLRKWNDRGGYLSESLPQGQTGVRLIVNHFVHGSEFPAVRYLNPELVLRSNLSLFREIPRAVEAWALT
jgi:hypothetical protein